MSLYVREGFPHAQILERNMLTTSVSIVLGLAFVLLGGLNVWLVLESWSRVKAANTSSRMLALHRIGGYLFIALFCVMTYFMVARLRGGSADTSRGDPPPCLGNDSVAASVH